MTKHDALMETIRQYDRECTRELEQEWRDVLNRGIAVITSLY